MRGRKGMGAAQQGFTLIEIVAVLVILGLLAVVAVPRYIDLQGDAAQKAVSAVAGALSSGSSDNFAARKLNAANGLPVGDCADVPGLLQGGLPAGYTVTPAAVAAGTAKTDCQVTGLQGRAASFTAHQVD